ncbi:MAG: CYTH domain-containing protein [Gammaproteobacteria bacterium]|nr:CYTH domain-containing protein [Gammaproteobacteria bacterium]
MASEIERKFLLVDDSWREAVVATADYCQGYMATTEKASIRIRVAGDKAYLNIKGATLSIERTEYDYAIPAEDGREMLARFCVGELIEKRRHIVPYEGHDWEIDVFSGINEGLVMAEIELTHVDEAFARPPWLGKEVSDDHRYYNVYLAEHPFPTW